MLGGQWKEREKLPNAWWSMEREGEAPFTSFHFPPNKFYSNLHFFL
jgi:hypothetical protein